MDGASGKKAHSCPDGGFVERMNGAGQELRIRLVWGRFWAKNDGFWAEIGAKTGENRLLLFTYRIIGIFFKVLIYNSLFAL